MQNNLKLLALATAMAFTLTGCVTAKTNTADAVVADGDDDADGVLNSVDECPNTRAGATVDHRGCEILAALESTHFAFDSAKLTPVAKEFLASVSGDLQGLSLNVAGHTDSVGSDSYNQGLSERRANSVATFLAENGVDGSGMTVVGYGETTPVASNDTKEGRAQNRRVDVSLSQ